MPGPYEIREQGGVWYYRDPWGWVGGFATEEEAIRHEGLSRKRIGTAEDWPGSARRSTWAERDGFAGEDDGSDYGTLGEPPGVCQ